MNICFKILRVSAKPNYIVRYVKKETAQNSLSQLRRNAEIIDGKQIALDIQKELKNEVDEWINKGHRPPCLVAILVGNNPASERYVKNKMVAAKNVGIHSKTINLPETTTEDHIISEVKKLNEDPSVDGVLVQLPVPEGISERNVCNAVDPKKDVDGFHFINVGKLAINMDSFIPATAYGVIELIRRTKIKTFGKNVVVCGRSKNVGFPIMMLLHSDGRNELPGYDATVTLCHRFTPPEELEFFAKRADIIITATGIVNLIKPEMVKPGACIIDVGINKIKTEDGKTKLVGDVDFEGVSKVAGHITPVPGGVGPMTVAMLMVNTVKAAKLIAAEKVMKALKNSNIKL